MLLPGMEKQSAPMQVQPVDQFQSIGKKLADLLPSVAVSQIH